MHAGRVSSREAIYMRVCACFARLSIPAQEIDEQEHQLEMPSLY